MSVERRAHSGPEGLVVLIVDDEPLARDNLRELLTADPELGTILECGSGREAMRLIRTQQPDIVLLDIQMPRMSGFEVIERVGVERMPVTVFVTAHDDHAVRAFEVEALDYMLKPVDEERLERAMRRAKSRCREHENRELVDSVRRVLERRVPGAHPSTPDTGRRPARESDSGLVREPLDRIAVKQGRTVRLIPVEHIDWIESADDYVYVHVGDTSWLANQRMSALEDALDPRRFVRIHRTAIVNLDRLDRLEPTSRGGWVVVLKNGTRLRLSRSRKALLEARLQQRL